MTQQKRQNASQPHPDNPTNLEAFHEEIADAIRLAKSGQKRTRMSCGQARLTIAVIRETMERATDLLHDELRERLGES